MIASCILLSILLGYGTSLKALSPNGAMNGQSAISGGTGSNPQVSTFVCTHGSALGAASIPCMVYLNAAAATGPSTVNLSSNNAAVTVPSSVTVPANAMSTQFTASIASVGTRQTAVVTASTAANSKSFQLTLLQAVSTLSLQTPVIAFPGYVPLNTTVALPVYVLSSGTMPLTISAGTISGNGFQLSGATFPMTLTPGQKASFTVQFDPTVAGSATGQLTLQSNSSTGSTTVVPLSGLGGAPQVSTFVCTHGSALGAASIPCMVYLNAAAATGPSTVNLSSNNAAVTVPSSVTVPANAMSTQFTASIASVGTRQTAVVTASTAANSKSFQLTLLQAVSTLSLQTPVIAFPGYVPLNTTVALPVYVLSSGTMPLTISAGTISGNGFQLSGATFPMTLTPGQKASFTVQFDPTVAGSATGQLTLQSNSSTGSTTVVPLSGLGGAPQVSTFVCTHGSALGAASIPCMVYLNAAAATGPSTVNLSSNNAAVTVPSSVTVPANAMSTQFTASIASVGTRQTAVVTASTAANSKSFQLTLLQAVSTLSLQTPVIAFPGYVPLNTTVALPVYVLSSGTMPLTISAGTISGNGFQLSGATFPMTLTPGQKASFTVQFDPTVAGSATGQLTLQSNSSTGSTTVVPLSGLGTPVGKFPGSPVVHILVPPNPTSSVSSEFFGMTIYNLASPTAGATSGLTPFPPYPVSTLRLWDVDYWADIEWLKGKYHWTKMDGDIAKGIQNGVKDFIFTFGQAPPWASTNPTDPCTNGEGPGTCSPPDLDAYDDIVTNVVQRYCGKIKYYEPWNEPNNSLFWDGTNAQMLTLAKHLYTIAKDPKNCGCTDGSCSPNGGINPNKVLLPPIAGVDPVAVAWLDAYLKDANMSNPYADIAAFHGYVWHGYQPEKIVPQVQDLEQTLDKYGLSTLELWNTEASFENDSYFDEQQQTSWLMRSYTTDAALGVSRFVWYAYDQCTWGTLWITSQCANNQAPANQLNRAGAAYGVIQKWLTGASLQQCQNYQSGLWACELQRPGGYDAWILWSTSGGNISINVPASLGLTRYHDSLNNINALPSDLTVTPIPTLLEQ